MTCTAHWKWGPRFCNSPEWSLISGVRWGRSPYCEWLATKPSWVGFRGLPRPPEGSRGKAPSRDPGGSTVEAPGFQRFKRPRNPILRIFLVSSFFTQYIRFWTKCPISARFFLPRDLLISRMTHFPPMIDKSESSENRMSDFHQTKTILISVLSLACWVYLNDPKVSFYFPETSFEICVILMA